MRGGGRPAAAAHFFFVRDRELLEFPAMEYPCLAEYRRQEASWWWFVNRRRIVDAFLRTYLPKQGRLLDVGCGGGIYGGLLAKRGWRVTSTDLDPAAAAYAQAEGVPAVACDAGGAWPFEDASYDAFLMLDVLEHLEHDVEALREGLRVLRPGGFAIILVPAHPLLFSRWDQCAGHFRRYTRRGLRRVIQEAGFNLLRLSGWNLVALPPAAAVRLVERFQAPGPEGNISPSVPAWINALLKGYGAAEGACIARVSLPTGLSLAAVAQKPASG